MCLTFMSNIIATMSYVKKKIEISIRFIYLLK